MLATGNARPEGVARRAAPDSVRPLARGAATRLRDLPCRRGSPGDPDHCR